MPEYARDGNRLALLHPTPDTMAMAIIDDARAAAATGGPEAAVRLIDERAEAGDADALILRGEMRVWGANFARDLPAARRDLLLAARLGSSEAIEKAAALVATGTGGRADSAAARALIAKLALRDSAAAARLAVADALDAQPLPEAMILSAAPRVVRFDALLTPEACRHVMDAGRARLEPSFVIDPESGHRIANPIRTSSSAIFGPIEEDVVIHAVNRRVAAAAGIAVDRGEPLHLLRYAPGEQYRPHMDVLPGRANQRSATMLLYLSDDYAGGETVFPALDLAVRGAGGTGLLFVNLDQAGRADPRMEHAGLPVTRGEKWLATRWMRERRVHPFEPETLA